MVQIQGKMPQDSQKADAEKDKVIKESLGRIKNKIIVFCSGDVFKMDNNEGKFFLK